MNVRWATKKQQGRNRGDNKPITINGKTKTIPEWSEELNVDRSSLRRHFVRDYYYNPTTKN
jgi:hypothetical protein